MKKDKNYYETLGVSKTSSKEEIKKSYRKLAKEYHPDKTKGDTLKEDKFKSISEAYEVLSDNGKRKRYDDSLKYKNSNWNFNFENSFWNTYESFYSDRMSNKKANSSKKYDLKTNLTLTIYDILNGYSKTVKVRRLNKCSSCNGEGSLSPHEVLTCSHCYGKGFEPLNYKKCDYCNGSGKVFKYPCKDCNGVGSKNSYSYVDVKIPKGFYKEVFVIKNEGNYIKDSIRGDIYINIFIQDSKKFKRDGVNVISTVEIGLLDALFGGNLIVETLDGNVSIKLKENIVDEKVFRLSNKGLPISESSIERGHHFIKVKIVIPTEVTDDERDILINLNGVKWKKTT